MKTSYKSKHAMPVYYFLFQITFFKKKKIPTYPDKIHDRGNYTIDHDSTQCSVF